MPDCLLDTNVLIYLVSVGAPEHVAATSAVGRILASGAKAVIAAQSIAVLRGRGFTMLISWPP